MLDMPSARRSARPTIDHEAGDAVHGAGQVPYDAQKRVDQRVKKILAREAALTQARRASRRLARR
jgi:hypothetical protein